MLTIKCNYMWGNTKGEGIFQTITDTEVRKRGEQTGFDILVVHAVNDDR